MQTMTPTHAEKMEWARMAQAAYSSGRNDMGHRYSHAASLPNNAAISLGAFDMLQAGYRSWLVFNKFPVNA